ncbi:hypothetical protein ACQEVB_03245 [Pseudonocardia sp. CA-107938]|uniref:hypothetical protein n=1 Tax=Pseudonocardia sp. CA-107938 TaxID=3240021 RepID=UPI003D93B860
MINFIPNDPAVGELPLREVAAVPDRPAGTAAFTVAGGAAEGVYPPGTAGFLRWQTRQAAILAVQAWEAALGRPIASWASAVKGPLQVRPDAGVDLNAFYDRTGISFFHQQTGDHVTYSGASTDVVAHETGHALLDALRPDLWDTNLIEVGGAHEAFGDITAVLTALSDRETREELLSVSPDLGTANFVEATAEDLSAGVAIVLGSKHPAAKPRRALNTFRWQLPETLPADGGPDVLISEVHSIARILSGCFYDLVRGLFTAGADRGESGLLAAARQAAALFWAGAAEAPEVPRFFRSIGRQMVIAAGPSTPAGAAIGRAFAGHGLALGSRGLVAPELALAGEPPRIVAAQGPGRGVEVADDTIADLRRRLDTGADAPVSVSVVDLGGTQVAKVSFQVEVPLDDVDDRLRGVSCPATVPALVGESGATAALLHAPRAGVAPEEAQRFVRTLIDHGQLALDATTAAEVRPTHAVVDRDGRREVRRVAFA